MKTVGSKEFGVIRMMDFRLGFAPAKATTLGVATRSRHRDTSRSEGDLSCRRVLRKLLSENVCKCMIIRLAWFMICDDIKRCIGTLSTLGECVVCGLYGVHVVCVEVSRGLCVVHVVSVYVACSLTPT
ncbi:hypothetical protein Taro_012184, partial [Colocasia esculenta]|nr:hypothetical protein [Colocasia esculenta]